MNDIVMTQQDKQLEEKRLQGMIELSNDLDNLQRDPTFIKVFEDFMFKQFVSEQIVIATSPRAHPDVQMNARKDMEAIGRIQNMFSSIHLIRGQSEQDLHELRNPESE